MKVYRLPNGEITKSVYKYIRNYRKLAKPICNLFKEEAKAGISYDPGLLLGKFSLTDSQAIKIYELIERKKFKIT